MKNKNTWQAERHLADDRASGFSEAGERVLDTEDVPEHEDCCLMEIDDDDEWYDNYDSVD